MSSILKKGLLCYLNTCFSNNYFTSKRCETLVEDMKKGDKCLSELQKKHNAHVIELTSNPLLLTLLCLNFDRNLRFTPSQAELYKDALEAFLKLWDSTQNIEREIIYSHHLTSERKEDLFSQLSWFMFKNNRYLIRQDDLEKKVAEFLRNLPNANQSNLIKDSSDVIRGLESQHGIVVERANRLFSFAHPSFQEYYCARYLEKNSGNLVHVVKELDNPSWRMVFRFSTEMFSKADTFLLKMHKRAKNIIKNEPNIISIMDRIKRKIDSLKLDYQAPDIKAYYMSQHIYPDLYLARALSSACARARSGDIGLYRFTDIARTQASLIDYIYTTSSALVNKCNSALNAALGKAFTYKTVYNQRVSLNLALDNHLVCALATINIVANNPAPMQYRRDPKLPPTIFDPAIKTAQKLGLESFVEDISDLKRGFRGDYNTVQSERILRNIMTDNRDIGYPLDLNSREINILKKYLYSINLIVDCLQSECYVKRENRIKILNELFVISPKNT